MGAQIVNTVNKTLGYNYRNTNERGTTAASKGTVFTFTDLSESKSEKATIVTNEGTINIIDQVPCTINGQPIKNNRKGGITTKSVSQTQSAGQATFTSSNKPIEYGNYNAAIAYIKNEINNETRNSQAFKGNHINSSLKKTVLESGVKKESMAVRRIWSGQTKVRRGRPLQWVTNAASIAHGSTTALARCRRWCPTTADPVREKPD